jgi:hypothetical protein
MQHQGFNQDDIQDFKNPKLARESNDRFKEFSSAIIAEEHEDQIVKLKIIVETNENFTDRDLPKI